MSQSSAYHQLGLFIVKFQHLEASVNDLFVLFAGSDEEVTRILVNDLDYTKRINTLDVLFAQFVDTHNNTDPASKAEFHQLMVTLGKLGQRRNDIVHSNYYTWFNVDGKEGLLRKNSKISGSCGTRKESEEELNADSFDADLMRLEQAAESLGSFRLKVIDWLYPEA